MAEVVAFCGEYLCFVSLRRRNEKHEYLHGRIKSFSEESRAEV